MQVVRPRVEITMIIGIWRDRRGSRSEIRPQTDTKFLIAENRIATDWVVYRAVSEVIEHDDCAKAVKRDDVDCAHRNSAYGVALNTRTKLDAAFAVWERACARSIGADEIALHQIAVRAGTNNNNPIAQIARYDVARAWRRASDDVVLRATLNLYSVRAAWSRYRVGTGGGTGGIGVDIAATDGIVVGSVAGYDDLLDGKAINDHSLHDTVRRRYLEAVRGTC